MYFRNHWKTHHRIFFVLPSMWVERDDSPLHDDWIVGISWMFWTFEVTYEA